ncbi:MAG: hypothetical protein SH850_17785, partial [Planctomycetaceae bacterium]|nr:hypothetical protein [Planctomycetaceae bacterium]
MFYDRVNLHQSNITGCHISYNPGGGIVCRGGDVRNIHIGSCDIESNHAPDAPPTANVLIDCSGDKAGIGEIAITGCTLQHNHNSPGSANIRILGASSPTVREGNVTISGNILSDVHQNVHLQDCRGVTITGNAFESGFDVDLLTENCVGVVVGLNSFDRNPRYVNGEQNARRGNPEDARSDGRR